MRRRGFALMPALWLIVVIGSVVMAQAARSSDAARASRNRALLTAAEWARNACLSQLRSQLAATQVDSTMEHAVRADRLLHGTLRVADTDLGGGVRCAARFVDLGSVANVNHADSVLLSCILRDESAVVNVLARRPFPNDDAMAIVLSASQTDTARRALLSTRGANRFNLNSAPLELLRCLDDVGPDGAMIVALARSHQRTFTSVAEYVDQLTPRVLRSRRLSTARLTVLPPLGAIVVEGYAGDPAIKSTLILTVRLRGTDVDILSVEEH